jgi:membrane-associated phospholipid phosphatase
MSPFSLGKGRLEHTLNHPSTRANIIFPGMPQNCETRQGFLLSALLALAAVMALGVDWPVADAFQVWRQSPTIHAYLGFFDIFETFGHGLGVVLVLLALHQLDPERRWAIPRLLSCALAAGLAADLLKMCILRIRPYDFAFDGSIWTTFGQWLPLLDAGSEGQSFPSGHTATAVGLATALIWLYPQGRLLFTSLAVLVGCQRIVAGAHYPSDVLVGAAAGSFVAQFFLRAGRLPAWFSHWEERWKQHAYSR